MWFLAKTAVNRTFPDVIKNVYRSSGTASMPQIAHGSDPGKATSFSFTPVRPDQGLCQEPQGNDGTGVWFDMCLLKSVGLDYWQVFKTWHSVWICSETWVFWTSLVWTTHLEENCSVATFVIFCWLANKDSVVLVHTHKYYCFFQRNISARLFISIRGYDCLSKEFPFALAPAEKDELSQTQVMIFPKNSVREVPLCRIQVLK